MIPVVDNNGQEELTSVYVAVHYVILYQRLAQRQGIQQSTLFYFQAFFQWRQWYDVRNLMTIVYRFDKS
jgi:hypothetical protein